MSWWLKFFAVLIVTSFVVGFVFAIVVVILGLPRQESTLIGAIIFGIVFTFSVFLTKRKGL